MTLFPATSGADLSPCRTWRYSLWRRWGPGPTVAFVGLNPSTADETTDDPTIRRCIGFARDTGHDMLNLYAFRATDPRAMWAAADPVGPDNDVKILARMRIADLVIAAWGAWPMATERALAVAGIAERARRPLHALGTSKDGHPRHPLYLAASCRPMPWTP